MPVHVTAQSSSPSQTHDSPGAQDFVVVGRVVVPASPGDGDGDGDEESEEHATRTSMVITPAKNLMAAYYRRSVEVRPETGSTLAACAT
jgi:hypothetical protein